MSEMIERVKSALSFYNLVCAWEHEDDTFDSSGSEYEIRGADGSVLKITGELDAIKKYDDLRARAVIKAMREPTSEMKVAGAHVCDQKPSEAATVFQKMIDAALKSDPEPKTESPFMKGGFQTRVPSGPRTGRE